MDDTIRESTRLELPLKYVLPGLATFAATLLAMYGAYSDLKHAIEDKHRYNWTLFDMQDYESAEREHNPQKFTPDCNSVFWKNHPKPGGSQAWHVPLLAPMDTVRIN